MAQDDLNKSIPLHSGARFIWGHTQQFISNPLLLMQEAWKMHGDRFRIDLVKAKSITFVHPQDVKHILIDNYANYPKGESYDMLALVFGEGIIFLKDYKEWKKHRDIVLPAFNKSQYPFFVDTMVYSIQEMLSKWSDGKEFELHKEMTKLSGSIVSRSLLSSDADGYIDDLAASFNVLNEFAFNRAVSALPLPMWIPSKANREYHAAFNRIDHFFEKVIEKRKSNPTSAGDLLDMLMKAKFADDERPVSNEYLKKELFNLFFAGYETTANALVSILVLLHKFPRYQDILREEVSMVSEGKPIRLDHLKDFKKITAFIMEALRLYPPVPFFGKKALDHDQIGNIPVAKGSWIMFCSYLTHRHPDIWDDPESFNPDRFLFDTQRPKCAFMPFAFGPRTCTGERFAYMEMQLLVALMVFNFTFKLANDQIPYELKSRITTQPKNKHVGYLVKA